MNWNKLEPKIDNGTAKLFVNAAGDICWDNGINGPVLPKRLLAKVSPQIIEEAKSRAEKRIVQQAEQEKKLREDMAASAAKIAEVVRQFGGQRTWGICGFYMEDMTGPRFTFDEIKTWEDWAGIGQYRENELRAVCYGRNGDFGAEVASIPLDRFCDYAGVNTKHKKLIFSALVEGLTEWAELRRNRAAHTN